jgi:hypothetical protein
VDRTRDLPPPGMDLPTGVKMPASLTFRDATSRDVFTAISRLANVSLIFDSAFATRRSPSTCATRASRTRSAPSPARRGRFFASRAEDDYRHPGYAGEAARVREESSGPST